MKKIISLVVIATIATASPVMAKKSKPFTTYHKPSKWQGFKIIKHSTKPSSISK
jgi:hypothetical protein